MNAPSANKRKLKAIASIAAKWYRMNGRRYPWRGASSPYQVLIAEILLRKTQGSRVLPTYTTLMRLYPTPSALAKAKLEHVRSIVAPLGLPKRAELLRKVARKLAASGNEVTSGSDFLEFQGVGQYVANAVDCLAFGKPAPMVDGATGRFLRRVFNAPGKRPPYADRSLWELATKILSFTNEDFKEVNLGLIDIATLLCRPKIPKCQHCPLRKECAFYQEKLAN